MAEALTIDVQARDEQKNKGTGSRVARRLRAQGRVPAILYGHKERPQPIHLSKDDVALMFKKHAHLTRLNINGQKQLAVVKDIQWDHLGKEVLHLDFYRVRADEVVETEVPLEIHGEPAGLVEGGRLEQAAHSVKVMSKPTAIPNAIRVEVGPLNIGDSIQVRDLVLPEGVTIEMDPDLLLVHVVEQKVAAEAPEEVTAEEAEASETEQESKEE